MSPESARPRDGGHVDAGAATGRAAWRPAAASRCGEGLDHAEHVVDRRRLRVRQLAHGLVQRAATAAGAAPWSGRASSLPVPQPARTAGRAQRVEQHGLADAAQPGEHERCARGGPARPARARRRRRRAARRGRPARAAAGRRRARRGSGSGPRWQRMALSSAHRRCGDTRSSCRAPPPSPRPDAPRCPNSPTACPDSGTPVRPVKAGEVDRELSDCLAVTQDRPIRRYGEPWVTGHCPATGAGQRSPTGGVTPRARPWPAAGPTRAPSRSGRGRGRCCGAARTPSAARPAPARPPSPQAASG